MSTVKELLEQWCQDKEVLVQFDESRASFSVDGANGAFRAAVLPLEDDRAMVCLYGAGPYVPTEQREAAAIALAQINFPLKLGAVFLNGDTGELSFRVTQLLPADDGEAAALMERVLLLSAHAMDQLLPALTCLCCP